MSDDIAARARRRTTAVVAAAAAVGLLVLAAVVGVVVLVEHRDRPASPPTAGATADGSPAASGSGTGQPPPPSSSAPTAPTVDTDLRWATVAGARVPVSASAGPRDSTAGRARGFAHTPLGAVLAAAHISLRLGPQAGPAVFESTLREQVVGGGAAALGQHLAEDYEQARAQLGLPYGEPAGRLYSTARGYQVTADSADAVTVRLLIEGPGTSGSVLLALTLRTEWVGADWVLVAPADGTWDTSAAVVTDAGGFTRFPDGG